MGGGVLGNRVGRGRSIASAFCCRDHSLARGASGFVAMAVDKSRSSGSTDLGTLLQPYLEESLLHKFVPPEGTAPIHYADFGCGTSATPLAYAKFVVQILKKRFGSRDVVCQFADLPSNDFNSLFHQLVPGDGEEEEGGAEERTWFAVGVPGSQYGRMFPRNSLHVAISTISLQFLPEVGIHAFGFRLHLT